jgi:hypothetical protein
MDDENRNNFGGSPGENSQSNQPGTKNTSGGPNATTTTKGGTTQTGGPQTGGPQTSTGGSASTTTSGRTEGTSQTGGHPETGGQGRKTPFEQDAQPHLVRVEEPQPKRGRGRPRKNPEEVSAPPKTIGEIKVEKLNTQDLTALLCGTFDLLSVGLGEHWKITPTEGENVAKPAARILNRLAIATTINKYSDYTLLAMATAAIVTPRVLISLGQKKKEVVNVANDGNRDTNSGDRAGEQQGAQVVNNNRPPERQVASTVPVNIHEFLPATV